MSGKSADRVDQLPLALASADGSPFDAGRQLSLPLADCEGSDTELIVTAANARAVSLLQRPQDWGGRTLVLAGPRKSGRSLHARMAAGRTGARVIDRADAREEEAVFDAWNAAEADGRPLLLLADHAPPQWQPRLPDLRSRLASSPVVMLSDPDDDLADALLDKLLLRRGLTSTPTLRRQVWTRLERTHLALVRFADAVDGRGALTRDGARQALEFVGPHAESLAA